MAISNFSGKNVDAALELATTIVKIGVGLQFGAVGSEIAGVIAKQAGAKVADRLQERRIQRMFDQCIDVVTERIMQFLEHEYRDIPSNEYNATILAVRDTFAESHLSTRRVVEKDLNPFAIRRDLQPVTSRVLRSAVLSSDAQELYARILYESCDYLVEFVAALPQFSSDALTELLKRESQIIRDLKQILQRMPASRAIDDYSADYQRAIVRKLDRMELFGADLDTASRHYPLNVAYVSLQLIRNQSVRPTSERSQIALSSGERVERAFTRLKRVLVIGEAGSGKTTLLRWLAVSSATHSFKEGLTSWNEYIPFVISLREFTEAAFPKPADLPSLNARQIADEIPPSWPHDLLRQGRALILVDGVDELPEGPRREAAKEWLNDFVDTYPNSTYVVTSRSPAVHGPWPDKSFALAELQPMGMQDIESFVSRWYDAIDVETDGQGDADSFRQQKRTLFHTLETDRNLRRLAVNPLLCSLICALNRSRQGQLPSDRMGVYRAALDMFLGRRDQERQISVDPHLTPEVQLILMQELAFWLIRQNLTTVSIERAIDKVARIMQSLPDVYSDPSTVTRLLMERSGLLREPVLGQMDFIHRTFQEYLAGRAAIDGDEIELLIANSDRDNWRDVIIFAVGHAPIVQREKLLRGLIHARKEKKNSAKTRLSILIVGCLLTASQLNRELREEINDLARGLLPPKSIETAESLAPAGDFVLGIVAARPPATQAEALASVRLASMIGGADALYLISEIAAKHDGIQMEIMRAQRAFDLSQYARTVFTAARLGSKIKISDEALLPFLGYFNSVVSLTLDPGDLVTLTSLGDRPPRLTELIVERRARTAIRGIERWEGLESLQIAATHMVPDLSPIAGLHSLRSVQISVNYGISGRLILDSLSSLSQLEEVSFSTDAPSFELDVSPLAGKVIKLTLSRSVRLTGEKRLPNLQLFRQ